MVLSADEIESLALGLLGGSVGAAIAYVALRHLPPVGDHLWHQFQLKHPFFIFALIYLAAFFGSAVARDLSAILGSALHPHSIAYEYLFVLAVAIPFSIVQQLYVLRHRDAHA